MGVKPYTGRLMLIISVHPPDNRRRDLDNILKALLDAMEGMLYEDDSQIDELLIRRKENVQGGSVHVTVEEVCE